MAIRHEVSHIMQMQWKFILTFYYYLFHHSCNELNIFLTFSMKNNFCVHFYSLSGSEIEMKVIDKYSVETNESQRQGCS